jgi:hypothetical protein
MALNHGASRFIYQPKPGLENIGRVLCLCEAQRQAIFEVRSPLYFRRFVAQFGCGMTRRFFGFSVLILFLALAQTPLFAEATNADLAKSAVLEKNVAYLRVDDVGKNLADEIQSAETALPGTNKIVGTVLDLRFADGDDSTAEQAVESLFASKKLPLAILINAETRGSAVKLAADLREARAGLIFGSPAEDLQPDISVPVNPAAEKDFLENPFGTLAQSETNSSADTNDFLPFIDHTSEADLVREKIKDGDEDENSAPPPNAEAQKPFIRDPVLARAVDLIKGLAVVRQSRL